MTDAELIRRARRLTKKGHRRINSVTEAAEALLNDWPEMGRGEFYRYALKAVHDCLDGECDVAAARRAFKAAAKEVRVLIGDN